MARKEAYKDQMAKLTFALPEWFEAENPAYPVSKVRLPALSKLIPKAKTVLDKIRNKK